MNKAIIIRYCEIHLKGKNRGFFEKMLVSNIKNSIKEFNCTLAIKHSRYVIENYSESDYPSIAAKLDKIAGVHTYSPALVVKNDFDEILAAAVELCKDKRGTFKVVTNRADKTFTPDSVTTSMLLGGKLLEIYGENLSVDVKNPDFCVNADIREDGNTYVYTDVIKAMSGMPVGSAGRGIMMISGGIDSPVAAYMTCKRGMKLDFIHFHSFPYTGEAAKQKVIDLTKIISEYNGESKLYVVPFTKIQEEIHKKCPEEFMITMMRRFMMRIAERLALEKGDQAIITGESLGQVASQTIESITSSNSVVSLPVLRPLIAFDKIDIVEISRKINTYETSILPFEDCCTVFLPKFPAIKPDLKKVLFSESKLDVDALIKDAMDRIETIVL